MGQRRATSPLHHRPRHSRQAGSADRRTAPHLTSPHLTPPQTIAPLRWSRALVVLTLVLTSAGEAALPVAGQLVYQTGSDVSSGVYRYSCVKADGTYSVVYGGQARDCKNRLDDHASALDKLDRLAQSVRVTSADGVGSLFSQLKVENNRDMFTHDACILKKCLDGAAARKAVNPNFKPEDTMLLHYHNPVPQRATDVVQHERLNAAERWLVNDISRGLEPSTNSAIWNRKMGGISTVGASGSIPDLLWEELTDTKMAVPQKVLVHGYSLDAHKQLLARHKTDIEDLKRTIKALTPTQSRNPNDPRLGRVTKAPSSRLFIERRTKVTSAASKTLQPEGRLN